MLATNIQQTRVYQEALAEGEARGEARGEAKGEARGEAKMIVLFLERQFGTVATEVAEQIRALPLDRLAQLSQELWDFSNLDDLQAWLDQ